MTTEPTIVDELALARDAARGDDWPGADGNPPDYLRAIAYALIDLADSARFCHQTLEGERGRIPVSVQEED